MSTRKQRHRGNHRRSFAELNRSFGLDGRMESEVWYIALLATHAGTFNTVIDVLEGHFGSLDHAWGAFESLDENIAAKYQEVMDCVSENG